MRPATTAALAGAILIIVGLLAGPVLAIQGGHDPVTICHKPGTPAEHTITVDAAAVPAHLRHGDYLGACTSTDPSDPPASDPPASDPPASERPQPTVVGDPIDPPSDPAGPTITLPPTDT